MKQFVFICLLTLVWLWIAMAICMLIDWLRSPKQQQRQKSQAVELPPDMRKQAPSVSQLVRDPRLLANCLFGYAIIGVLAVVFLPATINEIVSWRRSRPGGT